MKMGVTTMQNKLAKKKLKEMISSGFTFLSTDEIKSLIQNEVGKGADELDTDYIDLCFELLSLKKNDISASKKIKFSKTFKIILVAAMVMTVFVSTATVSAQFKLNVPLKIAQLINGDAKVDYNLKNADTTADEYKLLDTTLARKIAGYGISPITFPEELLKEDCSIIQIENRTMDKRISTNVNVFFNYSGGYGNFSITQLEDGNEQDGQVTVVEVVSGQIKHVNGMDVLVLEQEGDFCTIKYKDNNIVYDISFEGNLDTAMQLVESIK